MYNNIAVHSISEQTRQKEIKRTKAKEKLMSYCHNIYTVQFCEKNVEKEKKFDLWHKNSLGIEQKSRKVEQKSCFILIYVLSTFNRKGRCLLWQYGLSSFQKKNYLPLAYDIVLPIVWVCIWVVSQSFPNSWCCPWKWCEKIGFPLGDTGI